MDLRLDPPRVSGVAPVTTAAAGGPPPGRALGWLAPVSLIAAVGVLCVAHADALARGGSSSAELFFWVGLGLICLPPAARLASAGAGTGERVGTVMVFALAMYLTKVTYSPSQLAFSDEFVHLRSTIDDLSSGHLFTFNPLLPESARYPGLGGLTSGLVRLSGLPVATAGIVVIGSARLVLALSLYLLTERISRSARVAGMACFIYAANPNFLYWSAQFSYESLALPLVFFTLYLLSRRAEEEGRSLSLSLLAAAAILAVVVTHHLSSYFLAGVLSIWTIVAIWRRRRGASVAFNPAPFAGLALLAIGIWLATVAPITSQYLGSIASNTGHGLFDVLTGASPTRSLFKAGATAPPTWERALSIFSVLLTLGAMAWGALVIWRARRLRPLMLAPLALALLYPLLLPLRFIGSAAETANRSTEFVFAGVGVVVAVALLQARLRPRLQVAPGARAGLAAALATVIVLGGVAVSWQYSERLPESRAAAAVPYELGAQAVAADHWADRTLGPGRRFASDFLDHLGLATYGRQRPLWAPTDGVSAWEIMAPMNVDALVRGAIRDGRVEYVLVDEALTRGVPASGFYFDKGEPLSGMYAQPLSAAGLLKFDHAYGVSRIYDNGRQQNLRRRGTRMSAPAAAAPAPPAGWRGRATLTAVAALALLCGLATAIAPDGPPRIIAGILLVLLLPGYALTAAAIPGRPPSWAELIVCTLGCSLVCSILCALVLDVLPGKMGRTEWALALALIVLAAVAAALVRDRGGAPTAIPVAPRTRVRRTPAARTLLQGAIGFLALATALAAVLLARHAADRAEPFTELGAVPLSSRPGSPILVQLESHERGPRSFVLTVTGDGRPRLREGLRLAPGDERRLLLKAPPRSSRRVVVSLTRPGAAVPFLHAVVFPAGGPPPPRRAT